MAVHYHAKTTVEDDIQTDGLNPCPVNQFFHEGYEILVGPRHDMYACAIQDATDESEKRCLSALVDKFINHGTHAVYAKPRSAKNDWTGISLTFFYGKSGTPLRFQHANEIIIPTCHEAKESPDAVHFYNQLIVFDESVHEHKNFTSKAIINQKLKGRSMVSSSSSVFEPVPFAPLDGYVGKLPPSPLYCGNKSVVNNPVFLKLDTKGYNMNIGIEDIFV
ncbi:hypothetical protein EGW08_017504 [Elysia chlorotica]|uniref:Uncharacterized protein n=1 Tax=Elysia chlorotica TaxID=188477 RepID=A0A433SZW2_ELYCH|nr:hypothetical protein EGW08_017504 [Elysia chlorotica]